MTQLAWDETGKKVYETGTDRGVLFVIDGTSGSYGTGVAWNGLTGVSQSPDGASATPKYADNVKYLNMISEENFKGAINAYTYPDEFEACDGSKSPVKGLSVGQQTRAGFGLSYRTMVGNDTEGTGYGYKLHLVYGATASPSKRDYQSINDSPDAITFSWDFTTTPVVVPGLKPSAHLVIDSTKVDATKLQALETALYGNSTGVSRLPLPAEVITLLGGAAG